MINTLGAGWELCAQLHAVREGEQEGLRRLGSTGTVLYILLYSTFRGLEMRTGSTITVYCIITIEAVRFASVLWTNLYRTSYRSCLELNYRSLSKFTFDVYIIG